MTDKNQILEQHFRTNYAKLYFRVFRYLKNRERCEDVIQEAYCRALVYWDALDPKQNFDNWFSNILNNCVKDNHKEENQHGMLNYSETPEQVVKPSAIPTIIRKEVEERIDAEGDNVSNILRLALLQQFRPKEIAQLVPESVDNIRQIIHRFRVKIKEKYRWVI